jgi:Mg2+ and Co2+ transporter CorA
MDHLEIPELNRAAGYLLAGLLTAVAVVAAIVWVTRLVTHS